MKPDLHPSYHSQASVHCACGNSWKTGSTAEKLDVEICSDCHPFYSGKEKLLDTRGRVDKFKKRQEKTTKKKSLKV